ncbi:MAG: hypothetical protein AAGI07_02505 [Bacteroidota bacterium]
MEQLKEEQYITIDYWSEDQIIYANWASDFLLVEEVKNGVIEVLEEIQSHSCAKLINDNRELQRAWDGANEWITETWVPQATEAGLRKFAHIISPDVFTQLSAESMKSSNDEASGEFQMRIFKDMDEAKKWVLE